MAVAERISDRRFAPRAADRRAGGRIPARVPSSACARSTSRCSRRMHGTASSRPTPSSASTRPATTTLVMPQVEMGQGVYTSIAMILAEELDADFAQVTLEHAPPNDKLYGNPAVRHPGDRQFQFGPGVLEAAAQGGRQRARHAGAGRRAAMAGRSGKLHDVERRGHRTTRADASSPMARWRWRRAAQTPPKDVALKDPKDFVLIGKPLKRLDTPDKVNGKAVYGIDAMLPGMKFATLAACPVFGGKVGKVDDSAARKIPGVQKIVVLDDHGRRGRRSHVGGEEGPRCAGDRLGRRPERAHQFERHLAGSARGQRKGRRGREIRRRYRQGPRHRRQARGVLRTAVSCARDDGADERHGSLQARFLRNLDRHADHGRACSRRRRRRPGCRSRK